MWRWTGGGMSCCWPRGKWITGTGGVTGGDWSLWEGSQPPDNRGRGGPQPCSILWKVLFLTPAPVGLDAHICFLYLAAGQEVSWQGRCQSEECSGNTCHM